MVIITHGLAYLEQHYPAETVTGCSIPGMRGHAQFIYDE